MFRKFFNWLFPCKFNEPLCKGNYFGCRCGKGGSKQEEAPAPAPQVSPWENYWGTISSGIPPEQLSTWMGEWQKDQNFPWEEVIQDYTNFGNGLEPAFKITNEGSLQLNYNPYSPPGGQAGKMTPELATPLNWDEGMINQFNQNLEMRANAPLYPGIANVIKEREAARGIGEQPMTGVNIPIGGQLLGAEATSLSPSALLNKPQGGGEMPLTGSQYVAGG